MAGRPQRARKQSRPRPGLEHRVFLNLLRASAALLRGVEETLKPVGVSHNQYNVLRILRGAGPAGLACCEVAERMLTRDPDITRLLDRLEARGLVTRSREGGDRRVITSRISPEGQRILKKLDRPIAELHRRQLRRLGAARLRSLAQLLEDVRQQAGEDLVP